MEYKPGAIVELHHSIVLYATSNIVDIERVYFTKSSEIAMILANESKNDQMLFLTIRGKIGWAGRNVIKQHISPVRL